MVTYSNKGENRMKLGCLRFLYVGGNRERRVGCDVLFYESIHLIYGKDWCFEFLRKI